MKDRPTFRTGTKKAIDQLAFELGLPNYPGMLDWAYEVANPDHVDKYLKHYALTTDEDKKFVLMEMLIQATNDQPDSDRFLEYWKKLQPILTTDFKIHEFTIYYWTCFDNPDMNDFWTITPGMRDVWMKNC